MNKEIFMLEESLLNNSKKEFFEMELIQGLPSIEFGVEYSINPKNEKAIVIIYDFDNMHSENKFSVQGCMGLIMSFIHEKFLKGKVVSSDDTKFIYKIIRDDKQDNEMAIMHQRMYRSNNVFWQFTAPELVYCNNTSDLAIKNLQKTLDNEPSIRTTKEYKELLAEIK